MQAWISPAAIVLMLAFLALAALKLKGIARARATAPDILWERDDWEPPRLRLQTFRKAGKVAELSHIEALTLLGLPFQVILALSVGPPRRPWTDQARIRGESPALGQTGDGTTGWRTLPGVCMEGTAARISPAPADLAARLGHAGG